MYPNFAMSQLRTYRCLGLKSFSSPFGCSPTRAGISTRFGGARSAGLDIFHSSPRSALNPSADQRSTSARGCKECPFTIGLESSPKDPRFGPPFPRSGPTTLASRGEARFRPSAPAGLNRTCSPKTTVGLLHSRRSAR